jgi:hypothetical protein
MVVGQGDDASLALGRFFVAYVGESLPEAPA